MPTLRPLDATHILSKPQLTLLRRIAACSVELGSPACLVGGFVRDALLGRPVNDFDVVIEGDAIAFARTLAQTLGGGLTVHPAFRTAIWELTEDVLNRLRVPKLLRPFSPAFLDIITARSESYSRPGALPTVTPSNIDDDLRRRDFTINTMAVRLDGNPFGELLDPLGGRADLEAGLIRFVHPRSFVDDPTRMYRAVRYEQRYGFRIEDGTLRAVNSEARKVLLRLSGERLRHEFDLIFDEPRAAEILVRLAELDLLKSIHPAVPWDNDIKARLKRGAIAAGASELRRSTGWILWLMGLPQAKIDALAERLAFPAALTREISSAARLLVNLPSLSAARPSEWTARLDDVPEAAIRAVSLLAWDESAKQAMDDYLSKWKQMKPRTTGRDLQKRGLQPGPRYKEILSCLRAAWLDGEVTTEKEEFQLLERLL
jgi:tRNA nucleotidyltransferase (CCA-adding enzyme)